MQLSAVNLQRGFLYCLSNMLGSDIRTIIGLSILAVQVLFMPPSEAQEPHNYFGSHPPKLLENVEKFHLNQGIEKMRNGQIQYAKEEFEFILRYFPNHPRGLMLMGELAVKEKMPALAEQYFQRAIDLYPETAATYMVYAIFLQKIDNLDKAIKNYQKALKLAPGSTETHYNLGLAYFQKKDYEKANHHAQIAYEGGFPLPGLRKKLKSVNAWKTP